MLAYAPEAVQEVWLSPAAHSHQATGPLVDDALERLCEALRAGAKAQVPQFWVCLPRDFYEVALQAHSRQQAPLLLGREVSQTLHVS